MGCFILLLQKNGAYSFKGIPYAAPPVGNLRWAPPQQPVCSSGVTDAGRFRSMCPQVRPLSSAGRVMGQEDCLFVNVWTSSLHQDAKLPVMVWIHGGYLHMLSGGEQGYSPTEKLAADTGVVYVSFNYRLNAFGFLALEILREGSPTNTSGQCGTHTNQNHIPGVWVSFCLWKYFSHTGAEGRRTSDNVSMFHVRV